MGKKASQILQGPPPNPRLQKKKGKGGKGGKVQKAVAVCGCAADVGVFEVEGVDVCGWSVGVSVVRILVVRV